MDFTAADKIIMKNVRDVLYDNAPNLTVYLGAMESVTSSDTTTITVTNTVRGVLSVWLASDTTFVGTNYITDPKEATYTGKVITLDTALPGATTDVVVAYYSDCPACGWSESEQTGRDPACATCLGLGRTLADGDAQTVPVKILSRSNIREELGIVGEEASGILAFKVKAEYQNMMRAAIKMLYQDRELRVVESPQGVSFAWKHDASGQLSEAEIVAEYRPVE